MPHPCTTSLLRSGAPSVLDECPWPGQALQALSCSLDKEKPKVVFPGVRPGSPSWPQPAQGHAWLVEPSQWHGEVHEQQGKSVQGFPG